MKKETKPIKAIDDSYEALSNKDRAILFAKIFGTIILIAMALLASVGALNYGVEHSAHQYTIAGAVTIIATIIEAVKAYKNYDTYKILNK